MLSRALRLATVTLLIGCLTAAAVRAVENLEAGKSPAQIFAGTCNACHKSPRGLLRSVPASSLSGFLRQHYTTSSDMASVLSSYLVSNGATDTRQQGKDAKQGKDGAKEGTKEAARAPADAKQQSRLPRPGETTDPMRPDLVRPDGPAQAAIDPKQKQKQGKKGQEPARTEPAEPPKETAKGDEGAKPAGEAAKPEPAKTESAKVEPSGASESSTTRPDPVPAVTPAPATAAVAPSTTTPSAPLGPAPGSSTVPVQPLDSPALVLPEPPKAPTVAEAPALPPVPPAGPPVVPISH
jgi:hypothetical protein